MNTGDFNVAKVLSSYNKKAKKYHDGSIWLMVSLIVLNILAFMYFIPDSVYKTLELHSALIALIILFLVAKTRIGDRYYLKNIILIHKRKPKSYTLSHFIRASLRALTSFFLFYIIALVPMIVMILTDQFDGTDYATFSGQFFILVSLCFFICFGVVLLPDLIQVKTRKKEHKYLYWFYFIKGRMSSSGFTLFIGVPLAIITTLIIVLTTRTYNEAGTKEFLTFSNVLEINRFALFVTSFGIWLSFVSLLISDILKHYSRLYAVYEDYTSFILRERMLNGNTISHILIGYTNLTKRSLVQLTKNTIIDQDAQKNPTNYFELVIDRQFNLRLVSRRTVVIEEDSGLFEETRYDSNSGISFGFVDSGELRLKEGNNMERIPEMATFGIVGDASDMSVLKFAGVSNADIVVNTSNKVNMAFDIKRLLEEHPDEKKPVLITTVRDSASFSFLEMKNNLAVFPINPLMTEGAALGSRLFMLLTKMANKNDCSFNHPGTMPKVVILGRGKSVYYTLKQFVVNAIANHITNYENLIEENFILVSDDAHLRYNTLENGDQKHWICEIGHTKTVTPMLSQMEPDYYDSVKIAMNKVLGKPARNLTEEQDQNEDEIAGSKASFIFVIVPREPHEGLRITYNVKQFISEYPALQAVVLASVETSWMRAYQDTISSLEQRTNEFLGNYGFPMRKDDLIIKKDIAAGSQITSLMECLDKHKPGVSFRNNDFTNQKEKAEAKTGVIAVCATNSPGILVDTLCLISGISNLKASTNCKYLPNFYYSYSYRISDYDQKWNDTFVIRGDCQLTRHKVKHFHQGSCLNGIQMNGTKGFLDQYADLLKTKVYDKGGADGCGFHPLCPVSSNNKPCGEGGCRSVSNCSQTGEEEYNNPIRANVKIWADGDSVPGSLAIALANFLMLGADLRLDAEENNSPLLNIVYENCSACTLDTMLTMRFFTKAADINDIELRQKRAELLAKNNIIGIKIKLSAKADKAWKKHFGLLRDYMMAQSGYTFDAILMEDELQLFNEEIRDKTEARTFFAKL